MKHKLDFALLTRPETQWMFVRLPPELEKKIEPLPETYSRIEGALKFCWHISAENHSDEAKATRHREAYMRASLAEYVSIEDTLNRDLIRLGKILKGQKAYKILNSANPMLHIVRELRNLEIHLTSSQMSESKKDIIIRLNKNDEKEIQTSVWTINDLTVEKFESLKYAKNRYFKKDIVKMVNWFNEAQHDWGVKEIIYRSICEVTSEIIDKYSL